MDSGPGISPAVRERIFEPFFTTKKDVGTGLGLWISKEIVDRHGGNIEVRSQYDNGSSGSIFNVSLPLGDKSQNSVSESSS
jgi:signal transduction histidine kinase